MISIIPPNFLGNCGFCLIHRSLNQKLWLCGGGFSGIFSFVYLLQSLENSHSPTNNIISVSPLFPFSKLPEKTCLISLSTVSVQNSINVEEELFEKSIFSIMNHCWCFQNSKKLGIVDFYWRINIFLKDNNLILLQQVLNRQSNLYTSRRVFFEKKFCCYVFNETLIFQKKNKNVCFAALYLGPQNRICA